MSGPRPDGDGERGAAPAGPEAGAGEEFLARAMEGLAAAAERTGRRLSGKAGRYAKWVRETLAGGGTVVFCGNGGSASTAEHVAAEYAVRFLRSRRPLPAVALTANSAQITAAANDYGYAEAFARSLRAWAGEGDLVVVHSTSGNSSNIVRAVEAASRLGARTVALTGSEAGALARAVDLCLAVPSDATARVQEIHLAIEHAVADRVDAAFAQGERNERQPSGTGGEDGGAGHGGG